MPSIAVRISSVGDLLGTGFIVSVPSETVPDLEWPYVVTAHHVIKGQIETAVEVPDPVADGALSSPLEISEWRQPLNLIDLAIAPFPESDDMNYMAAALEDQFLDVGLSPPLGCVIYYIGIFAPMKIPMARGGTLGASRVPIKRSYPGGGKYVYEAHLIDCRSYAGFSGSPCFMQMPYTVANETISPVKPFEPLPSGEEPELNPIYFQNLVAGLFTAHYSDDEHLDGVVSRYGVGVMLPSRYIWEALMAEEAKAERRTWDQEYKAGLRYNAPDRGNA